MTAGSPSGWNESWEKLDTTISEQDVWLLTDRIKLRYLLRFVPAGAKSLEVGCGSAKLSALLAERGVRAVGLDLSPQALRVARNNFAWLEASGDLLLGDAFQLPFTDEQFDVVLSTGLLEHFVDPTPLVAEMVRVLRRGGLFFSDVAPLKFSLLRAGFFLRGRHRREEGEFACTRSDIAGWLKACGLKEARVFSSGLVPPLGLIRRLPLMRSLCFRIERLWGLLDGTVVADWLGFFYLALAKK